MKLVLGAIASGGVLGAADQYLCLLIVSILAKTGMVDLTPGMDAVFGSWWFIGIIAFFWVITMLPSYATFLSPGVMNVVNTVVNLVSGFLVPVSGALLALASVGVITGMHPELRHSLQAMQFFDVNGDGSIGDGLLVVGGSALTASALTGAKFLAKPAVSSATGTAGTVSAPIYKTLENLASVVLMALLYILSRINPWLLVALFALVTLAVLAVLGYAIYKLWKLAKGIGRVIHLIETKPKVGLSIVAEFFVWGAGSMIWQKWPRGIFRMAMWVVWLVTIFFVIPGVMALLAGALVVAPVLEALPVALFVMAEVFTVITGAYVGLCSARSLMKLLDQPEAKPPTTQAVVQPSVS